MNSYLNDQVLLELRDASAVAEARRMATRLAGNAECGEVERGNVALVATELATNLIKHAKRGRMVMRLVGQREDSGIEILALDSGPGIKDVAQSMRDGYSTAGSPGTGFGAIKRLACQFDVHSLPGKGTAIVVRLPLGRFTRKTAPGMEFGMVCLPMPGQEVSGDGWGVERIQEKSTCVLVDGLGHGPDAAIAAQAALSVLKEHRDKAPAEIMERAHGALRSTRGAAVAVAEIQAEQNSLRFCGVGNIVAAIISDAKTRHLVSHNGIVGQEARKITEFRYTWSPESLLIMHSDGLTSRWDLLTYPALIQRHPSLIAGVLYRDFSRGRDDMTVLVAKDNSDFTH